MQGRKSEPGDPAGGDPAPQNREGRSRDQERARLVTPAALESNIENTIDETTISGGGLGRKPIQSDGCCRITSVCCRRRYHRYRARHARRPMNTLDKIELRKAAHRGAGAAAFWLPQQQARADRKTFEAMAEEPKSEFDVRDIFTPLDDGEWGPALGRPDDYPGFESLSVLLTGRSYRAGKSYRPDSSGLRRASKVDDYSLGQTSLQHRVVESLEEVFTLLQKLSNGSLQVRGARLFVRSGRRNEANTS